MAVIENSSSARSHAFLRYIASLFFGIAVIVGGVKVAVDHWPSEFNPKRVCSRR
jgi:hypothetical protein